MAIITKKFSEFVAGDLNNINRVVGLSNGANAIFSSITTWTTLTRPTEPANGLLGYNISLQQYEFFDDVSDSWVQLQDGGDVAALIARLAAHTAGDGASMIGLENQGSVTGKTAQDLAEAEFIVKTNNGSLLNAQAMGVLSTGIVKNTTGTGVQSISSPLTSIDSLSAVADRLLYASDVNTYSLSVLTSYARSLLAATNAANAASILEVLPLLGATMLGIIDMGNFKITNLAAPISPLDAVNKTYVDSLIINVEQPCVATTTANLSGYTYNNGTAGLGATLTAGSNGVFSTDGYSPAITTRILVAFQSITFQNGVYTLTQVGSGSTPAILTRATDYDTPSQIQPGDRFTILNGTLYAGSEFIETAIVTTIGTDPITFVQNSNNSYLLKSANLSDVASAATSRTNLGLGTAATKAASDNLNSTVLSTTLTSSQLFVGNVSNIATGVALSGDATLSNTGGLTLSSSGVSANSYTVNGSTLFTVDVKGRVTSATSITIGASPTGSAGGDLAGTYPNPAVEQINGVPLGVTTATSGNILIGSGTAWVTNAVNGDAILSSAGAITVSKIGGKAISLANSFTTSGNFTVTQTYTGSTNVTFPTTGTLATTSQLPSPAALTKTDDTNVTLTLGGSPTTALLNATSITAGWTGQLGLTRGGTNASLTASNGGIIYSTASALAVLSATATANQLLMSGANTTPAWSTATYPSTATTSGTVLRANGTNWLSSTSTFADTYAISTILYASSANTVSGLATANNSLLITNSSGVPSLTNQLTNDFTITKSSSGTNVTLECAHTSNTANSNSIILSQVAGASGGDATYQATVGAATTWSWGIDNSDADSFVVCSGSAIGTNNTIHISTGGQITYPMQSNFLYYLNSSFSNLTGDGTTVTIVPATKIRDANSDFNSGTGTFTAPITGTYNLSAGIDVSNLTASVTQLDCQINTSNRTWILFSTNGGIRDSGNNWIIKSSVPSDMDIGDTATFSFHAAGTTKTVGVTGNATNPLIFFGGNLVG